MAVPESPPGLEITWSSAETGDAADLSRVFNEVAAIDGTPERVSPETMRHELVSAYDPLQERTIVARLDREIVGYGTVHHRAAEASELRAYVAAYVTPAHSGQGLDEVITDWAIAAAGEVLAVTSAKKRYVCAWLYKQQQLAARRFEERGFEPVRHWWEMERFLDEELVLPTATGLEIEPWEAEHSRDVRLVANAAFVDHWGSTPMDEEAWRKRMLESPGFRQDLSFVAIGEGRIVGYAYNEVYPEDWEAAGRSEGWIGALGVLREWRNRGIATALLSHSMVAMRQDGLDVAMIGVDSASPSGAQHLYQSVGFRTKTTGTTWQREVL